MDVDEVSLPTYEMKSALSMTSGPTASLEKMGPLGLPFPATTTSAA
jgi:hypothetical protein